MHKKGGVMKEILFCGPLPNHYKHYYFRTHAHNENATNGLENLRWTSFLSNGMIMKMVVAWFRAFALI